MATLGLGVVASIALGNEVALTGGPDGMAVPDFSVFGWRLAGERSWYWAFAALLVARSRSPAILSTARPAGRCARCTARRPPRATLGVDASGFKTRVFVLSAVVAAFVGSLYGHYEGFVTPSLAAFPKSVQLVTMVVVGGMASIWGSVLGAALLSLAPELLARFEGYETIGFGAILVGDDDLPAARDRAEPLRRASGERRRDDARASSACARASAASRPSPTSLSRSPRARSTR